MPKLTWNDKFSVKIAQIDSQHKKLIDLVNQLSDAMAVGKGKEVLGPILDALISYTQVHFANEEKLMLAHGYPGLAAHVAEHRKLTTEVIQIQERYRKGGVGLTIPVLNFLNEWLTKHILNTDMQYSGFLVAKGVK